MKFLRSSLNFWWILYHTYEICDLSFTSYHIVVFPKSMYTCKPTGYTYSVLLIMNKYWYYKAETFWWSHWCILLLFVVYLFSMYIYFGYDTFCMFYIYSIVTEVVSNISVDGPFYYVQKSYLEIRSVLLKSMYGLLVSHCCIMSIFVKGVWYLRQSITIWCPGPTFTSMRSAWFDSWLPYIVSSIHQIGIRNVANIFR